MLLFAPQNKVVYLTYLNSRLNPSFSPQYLQWTTSSAIRPRRQQVFPTFSTQTTALQPTTVILTTETRDSIQTGIPLVNVRCPVSIKLGHTYLHGIDTSAASFNVSGLSPAGSGYQSSSQDKTPSPIASNMLPQALVSPSVSNMSVAAMVSPSMPGSADRRFDRPTSLESGYNGASLGENLAPAMGGPRRESVDSRINQGFSDMRLGNSPYASHNQSTTSIQNALHAQRNPRPALDTLSMHRISNGYQPNADRNPDSKTVKTAPAITGPATGHIARAAEPTKGQAWAFPEEEIQRVGSAHYDDSRRSSITESIASSQFTTESRLPAGQRRLEGPDYPRMSNASEFPPVHHHSMQHKQLSDLQAEEVGGATGSQPYSRTPELRVSHKLAERKRRTEMKELFDQLRDLMPQERGSKASKWEILTKGMLSFVSDF